MKRLLDSGATVRIWDRDRKTLDQAVSSSGTVSGAVVDVTEAPVVTKAVDDAIKDLGRIDVLVNNAGVAGLNVPTVDYPVENGSASSRSTSRASSSAAVRSRRTW